MRNGRIKRGEYWYTRVKWHPNHPNGGYIAEHRLIMERKINRFLKKKEVVHHIDGNPENNIPSNLELFSSTGQHTKHAHPEAIENGAIASIGRPPWNKGVKQLIK